MIRATLLRMGTLRSVWLVGGIALVLAPLMTAMTCAQIVRNRASGRVGAFVNTSHLGLDEAHLLLPVAMVIGVLIAQQDHSSGSPQRGAGRQGSTTALAWPRRGRQGALEALLTAVAGATAGLLATGAAMAVARVALDGVLWSGDPVARLVGMGALWGILALLAHCLVHLTRTAIVPLLALLVLTTLVPAWALVQRLTGVTVLLPDAAGIALFRPELLAPAPPPGTAAGALLGWTVLLVVVTALARERHRA